MSVDARPSIRPMSPGMCAHENANVSDSPPSGSTRENESERVKGFENEGDCERLVYEDVSKKKLQLREEWYANVSASVIGCLGGANGSKSVCLNVSAI